MTVRVVTPIPDDLVTMAAGERSLLVLGALPALTIKLPPNTAMRDGEAVDIGFSDEVGSLALKTSTLGMIGDAPLSADGPGAAIIMRWVAQLNSWVYWK